MSRTGALERRESVIRAAITEFAIAGYHGTITAAIVKRVGVTQPYLFRLFADKKTIFVAALMRSTEDAREGGRRCGGRRAGSSGHHERLRAADLDAPRNAPDADAGVRHRGGRRGVGRDVIGEVVRAGWMRIRETVHQPPGADADKTASFFACGMLGNTLAAIGLPSVVGR
ncbi:TetR/AcrR family transcriptional regulator [Streptomyces europaeiscabiei]|uniref:TetR/AcrR family transcriptional regulator n=1 Tax=Streptomyces europaeiscabiei TaxID=146819 RepID=UPI000B1682A3